MRIYKNRKISVSDIKNRTNLEVIPPSTLYYYRKKLGIKASCVHPNKEKIIEALKTKELSWSAMEKKFGCSSSTISRYNKEIKVSLSQTQEP